MDFARLLCNTKAKLAINAERNKAVSKIILSSCNFQNIESAKGIYDHLPAPIQQCKALYFPSEKATEDAIKSQKFYSRLSEFGKENKTL
ncbi:MAG: hypothetical protein IJC71_00990 [Clostridia bacterium]|nr:hypothetical protein [Clostridia bacterium]